MESKKTKKDKKSGNIYLFILIATGSILFSVVLWVVLSSTRSITAVVPNQSIAAGTTITADMIKYAEIPANTPTGYITDENSLIGQKVKIQVDENQMLYPTNVQTSFNMFGNNVQIPENYILTNINIPDTNAVSGLISAGDSVDIAGIPSPNYQGVSTEDFSSYLGGISENSFGSGGIKGYWVLSNVKILQSYKSQSESVTTGEETTQAGVQQGSYIVALSYADYKKLLISQQYLDLYMNVGPQSGFNLELINEGSSLNSLGSSQEIIEEKEKDTDKTQTKETDKTASATDSAE